MPVRASSAGTLIGAPSCTSASSTGLDVALLGDGGGGEVLPDALVGLGREQHRLGALDGPAGAADLLVVGDGRVGRAEVHAEAEVGLVVAHAERGGGDDRLQLVGAERVLHLRSRVVVSSWPE